MRNKLLFILLCLINLPIWAQIQLKGKITDNQSVPIGWATVILQANTNAKEQYYTTSNEDGSFEISDIKNTGVFTLSTSFIGYVDLNKQVEIKQENLALNLTMTLDQNILDEVLITSHRKALKVTPGKATLNIAQSNIAQTQSAFDVLKSLPGVTISQSGDIKIKGRSGVTILMDGQPTQLSTEQLKTILKGTPGSTLESVEIMNIPPASIDATGTGGVINIISKKRLVQGLYGTINSTVGISRKVSTDHSLNIGYGNDKWNYNFLYSYSYTPDKVKENYLKEEINSTSNRWLAQTSTTNLKSKSHLAKFDITRTYSNGNSLNLSSSVDFNDTPSSIKTKTDTGLMEFNFNQSSQNNQSKSKLTNFKTDLKYRAKLSEKANWTTSLGVKYIKSDLNDIISNGSNTNIIQQQNAFPSNRKEINFRSDYVKNLWDGEVVNGKMEFGIKSNYSILKADEELKSTGQLFLNDTNSQFKYKNGVHALYGSFDVTVAKWTLVAGLRGEYTHINADTLKHANLVKQKYFSLFPTVQLTYKASDNYSIMAAYSRRIERPDFTKLNPAVRYLNSTTTSMGNPNLQPEFSNNIELTQQLFSFIDITLGYSKITDPMLNSYFSKDINKSYLTTVNGKNRSEWQASLSFPIPIFNWWENYQGVYFFNKRFDNNIINENKNSIGAFTYNNFKLPNKLSIELIAWYQNGGIEANYKYKSLGEVNISVSKKFLDDKLTATFSVNDIFKTSGIKTNILENTNQLTQYTVRNDMRVFKFGVSYNFGGPTKKEEIKEEDVTKNLPIKKILK